jgi:hypothetical protein
MCQHCVKLSVSGYDMPLPDVCSPVSAWSQMKRKSLVSVPPRPKLIALVEAAIDRGLLYPGMLRDRTVSFAHGNAPLGNGLITRGLITRGALERLLSETFGPRPVV